MTENTPALTAKRTAPRFAERVSAAPSPAETLGGEAFLTEERFAAFRSRVSSSKLDLMALLQTIRRQGHRIYAVGAPSRAVHAV